MKEKHELRSLGCITSGYVLTSSEVASQENENRKVDTESSGYLVPQWLEVQRPV